MNPTTNLKESKTKNGYFGDFGGMFVPPNLEQKLQQLAADFYKIRERNDFKEELRTLMRDFVGRPSSLYYARNLSDYVGSKIYLKREDLNHTGAHKINNTMGQILLAKYLGAKEIIAETGAGQHGVATATAAALFGMHTKVFMGKRDVERQQVNVKRMHLLGAEVVPVANGTATLKDAVDEAINYFVSNEQAFYLLGSAVGPHPYPEIVGYFQSVIGEEAREQFLEKENRLPDSVFACIGGGSNAIGIFRGFVDDPSVEIHAAEGGGSGAIMGKTAATLSMGKPKVFQGTYSYCLLDDAGEPVPSASIAAGLDYPGIGPEHAHLKETGRVNYHLVTDQEAIDAYKFLARKEGIIPAIESSHAIALAMKLLKDKGTTSIINLSGRGDKDVERDLAAEI